MSHTPLYAAGQKAEKSYLTKNESEYIFKFSGGTAAVLFYTLFCCLMQDKISFAEPENFSAQCRLQSLNCSRTKHWFMSFYFWKISSAWFIDKCSPSSFQSSGGILRCVWRFCFFCAGKGLCTVIFELVSESTGKNRSAGKGEIGYSFFVIEKSDCK